MPMMAPMLCSTWMTKTFLSFPTKIAQPLFAGNIPRISTGTTSFFMASVYDRALKKQASHLRTTESGKAELSGPDRQAATRKLATGKYPMAGRRRRCRRMPSKISPPPPSGRAHPHWSAAFMPLRCSLLESPGISRPLWRCRE
jgi:hypothetical protein